VEIDLKEYIHDIEILIDQNKTDEAISHLKHILNSYPKYLDAYRMLGKAYLENQRYSYAADIFSRLLSVIPDDFVALLGMSIISEEEKNLDAAIWYMERSYEINPNNTAIKNELKRLYGNRDGIEPESINLSHGVLVRMYTRGKLYNQAIAEAQLALQENSKKIDIETLLSELYYLSGNKEKAIESSFIILEKLPYNLTANCILAELLVDTPRAEDAIKYQQTLLSLDPYKTNSGFKFVADGYPQDKKIYMQKLEYGELQTIDHSPKINAVWTESLSAYITDQDNHVSNNHAHITETQIDEVHNPVEDIFEEIELPINKSDNDISISDLDKDRLIEEPSKINESDILETTVSVETPTDEQEFGPELLLEDQDKKVSSEDIDEIPKMINDLLDLSHINNHEIENNIEEIKAINVSLKSETKIISERDQRDEEISMVVPLPDLQNDQGDSESDWLESLKEDNQLLSEDIIAPPDQQINLPPGWFEKIIDFEIVQNESANLDSTIEQLEEEADSSTNIPEATKDHAFDVKTEFDFIIHSKSDYEIEPSTSEIPEVEVTKLSDIEANLSIIEEYDQLEDYKDTSNEWVKSIDADKIDGSISEIDISMEDNRDFENQTSTPLESISSSGEIEDSIKALNNLSFPINENVGIEEELNQFIQTEHDSILNKSADSELYTESVQDSLKQEITQYNDSSIITDTHDISTKITQFQNVLDSGGKLENLIEQLDIEIKKYPNNYSLWQILGDANAKSNKIQDAIDAYTKAENILNYLS